MSIYMDIEKRLGAFMLSVKLEAGNETLALLGASGCGKSMTLKCIAGIERPDRGRIVVDGVTLFDSEKRIDLTPQKRRTGLMFQNYALFPNMTVRKNIEAGARRGRDSSGRKRAASDIIDALGLSELADRYPHEISGGQQQRTALARILVSEPDILLLDEPFSALDSHLRFRLEREVRDIIARFGKTALLVSHDRDEVYRMADSIAVMEAGSVTVCGTKKEVFASPNTVGAAMLTGCKNISRIEVVGEGRVRAVDWGVTLDVNGPLDGVTAVGIRMHDVTAQPGANAFKCRVVCETENPFSYTVMLMPEGAEAAEPIGWETDKDMWNKMRAAAVDVSIPPEALLLLKGGERSAL